MLDPAVKKRWIKALRSGKYKQGKNYLCYTDHWGDDTYCCLGVLCDIEGEGHWTFENGVYGTGSWSYRDSPRGKISDSYLPKGRMTKRLGLSQDEQSALANMNDNGNSFEIIAEYIEKNL